MSRNFVGFPPQMDDTRRCERRVERQFFISGRKTRANFGRKVGGISTAVAQELQKGPEA